jgi:hypothetical protein
MALFVFGEDVEPLGRLGDLECSACQAKRPFTAAAKYFYFLVGVFGVAGGVRYFVQCAACRRTWRLDRRQAKDFKREGLLVPPDMPPLRRYGLLAAAVVVGALVSLNKLGPFITAVWVLAAASMLTLPRVVRGVRRKGFKAYARDAVSPDKPVSLFESVGGPPAGAGRDWYWKCPACGLNNATADERCERCGAELVGGDARGMSRTH